MPSQRDVTVKSLSSNLLQMKFMRRTALSADQPDQNEVYPEDDEHWYIDKKNSNKSKLDMDLVSHAWCEELYCSRLSFKGFNPAIEKLMRASETLSDEEEKMAEEDQQFAEEYSNVSSAIAKKFMTKKQRAHPYKGISQNSAKKFKKTNRKR